MDSDSFAKRNFWFFFWSTVSSIVGMDLYLFTHGWYLLQLGGDNLSIGLSWSIFFIPGLLMLPVCSRLLKERSIRSIQLTFEIAKAGMLWLALLCLVFRPSVTAVYCLSAFFGFLFAPFYPATYSLLKQLFADAQVVKHSNLFEVSLQLAGATALFFSGFIYEKYGFLGIVLAASLAVTTSCIFLSKMDTVGRTERIPASWASTYVTFFKLPAFTLKDPKFIAGTLHQIPQSAILLSNIPLVVYVSHKMHAGPREYGYIDSIYALAGLGISLFWTKWPTVGSDRQIILASSAIGSFSFLAYGFFPAWGIFPYVLTIVLALSMTSAKILSRSAFIQHCSNEFISEYTPFFQLVSNLTLIGGAFIIGAVMRAQSVDVAMYCLAAFVAIFSLTFPRVEMKLRSMNVG